MDFFSKNSPFASCAGLLKSVGFVAVTGLVFAVIVLSQPGSTKAGRPIRNPFPKGPARYCRWPLS
jgi:hypothetical protein